MTTEHHPETSTKGTNLREFRGICFGLAWMIHLEQFRAAFPGQTMDNIEWRKNTHAWGALWGAQNQASDSLDWGKLNFSTEYPRKLFWGKLEDTGRLYAQSEALYDWGASETGAPIDFLAICATLMGAFRDGLSLVGQTNRLGKAYYSPYQGGFASAVIRGEVAGWQRSLHNTSIDTLSVAEEGFWGIGEWLEQKDISAILRSRRPDSGRLYSSTLVLRAYDLWMRDIYAGWLAGRGVNPANFVGKVPYERTCRLILSYLWEVSCGGAYPVGPTWEIADKSISVDNALGAFNFWMLRYVHYFDERYSLQYLDIAPKSPGEMHAMLTDYQNRIRQAASLAEKESLVEELCALRIYSTHKDTVLIRRWGHYLESIALLPRTLFEGPVLPRYIDLRAIGRGINFPQGDKRSKKVYDCFPDSYYATGSEEFSPEFIDHKHDSPDLDNHFEAFLRQIGVPEEFFSRCADWWHAWENSMRYRLATEPTLFPISRVLHYVPLMQRA